MAEPIHVQDAAQSVGGGETIDISSGNHSCTYQTRGIWVGNSGDLVVTSLGGDTLTFKNVQDGTLVPVRATVVSSTTTATNMVAIW